MPPLSSTVLPMSTAAHTDDLLLQLSTSLMYFLMGIAFCPSVVTIVSTLVRDKEQRLREGMLMMGLETFTYYSS